MAKKLFYSMGEVSEMFDVNPSLIRHWESKFEVLKPQKNKKGNRMFTPEDVENLKLIYHLVKERGMTLDGARRALKGGGMPGVARDMELLERLQSIRAQLVEVRNELKESAERAIVVDSDVPEAAPAPVAPAAEVPAVQSQARRRGRRKKEEPGHKELFAFYEQSFERMEDDRMMRHDEVAALPLGFGEHLLGHVHGQQGPAARTPQEGGART